MEALRLSVATALRVSNTALKFGDLTGQLLKHTQIKGTLGSTAAVAGHLQQTDCRSCTLCQAPPCCPRVR